MKNSIHHGLSPRRITIQILYIYTIYDNNGVLISINKFAPLEFGSSNVIEFENVMLYSLKLVYVVSINITQLIETLQYVKV